MTRPMKPAVLLLALGLLGCASTGRGVVGSEPAAGEEAAILSAIDRFFIAMADGDEAALAAAQTPDGMTYSQRLDDGAWALRARANTEVVEALTAGEQRLNETYWAPTVLIRGPMAVVWAPYEFRIDGETSHCGVDIFNMLKIDGEWVIGNAMWTVEPEACDELRPRRGARVRPAELVSP